MADHDEKKSGKIDGESVAQQTPTQNNKDTDTLLLIDIGQNHVSVLDEVLSKLCGA